MMLEDLGDVARTQLDRRKHDELGESSQIVPVLVSTEFEVRRKATYYRQTTNNLYCAIPR